MDPKLIEKLKRLREHWYNDDYSLKWVSETEKAIHRIVAQSELAKHKAVIPIIEDARARISAINKLLIYDSDMDDKTRKMLIRERDVHHFWLDRFDGSNLEERLAVVGRVLDEEIERAGITVKGKK